MVCPSVRDTRLWKSVSEGILILGNRSAVGLILIALRIIALILDFETDLPVSERLMR